MPVQECVSDPPVTALPLVTLHLTDRCNSRCVACDYWRNGGRDVSTDSISRLLPSLVELGTGTILISGGEPLLHRQWVDIASMLRESGMRLWLLTSGLSLAKHATRVAQLFDAITVSLDGTGREMYASVRGLDAFDVVCEGIRAAAGAGVAPSVRVTVQRANYAALSGFVALARQLGARQVSFLAADVSNPNAFGRSVGFQADVALGPADLVRFDAALTALERDHAADFRSGFIEESPRKLRRLLDYYTAVCGLGRLSARALQRAGVLCRRWRRRSREPMLFYPRAGLLCRTWRSARRTEQRSDGGSPGGHSDWPATRVQNLRVFALARPGG